MNFSTQPETLRNFGAHDILEGLAGTLNLDLATASAEDIVQTAYSRVAELEPLVGLEQTFDMNQLELGMLRAMLGQLAESLPSAALRSPAVTLH